MGDVLVFTPHCHILVTDGCVYGDTGMFLIAPPLELKKLEAIFRHTVNTGQITKELIARLSPGRQYRRALSCCGTRLSPPEETARENLARDIIRASVSHERRQDLDQEGAVV